MYYGSWEDTSGKVKLIIDETSNVTLTQGNTSVNTSIKEVDDNNMCKLGDGGSHGFITFHSPTHGIFLNTNLESFEITKK